MVATVEVNRFSFLVVIGSILVSLLPAVVIGLLLGSLGIVALGVPVIFVLAGLFLVDQRTRKGLQLRRYEAMWDSRKIKALRGTVFVCGEPLHVPAIVIMTPSVLVANTSADASAASIATDVARDSASQKVRVL